MTPLQIEVLQLARKLNDTECDGWFNLSEILAFCQIESAFRPHAYRFEPRLGEGSYGLMQVLQTTARSVDPALTNPEDMYQPEVGLRIGMKVAKLYWEQLARHFRRDPTYEEWSDSYNRGVGGVEHIVDPGGEPDDAYTTLWDAAQTHWAGLVDQ